MGWMMSKFPWLRVWMLVFSIGGIWMTVDALRTIRFSTPGSSLDYWLALPILVVIALTALWKMPMPFAAEPQEDTGVAPVGRLYLDAWRKLLRTRWLLIIVVAVALIGIADAVTNYVLSIHYGVPRFMTTHGAARGGQGLHALVVGLGALPHRVADAPGSLFPSPVAGIYEKGVIPPIAILVLIPWLALRLLKIRSDHQFCRTTGVACLALFAAAVMAVLTPIETQQYWKHMWAELTATTTNSHAPQFSSEIMSRYGACTMAWSLVTSLFIAPFVIAGFAGSMRRQSEGSPVSGDTFVEDIVRHLKPLAGLYAALWGLNLVLVAPLLIGSATTSGRDPQWFGPYAMLVVFMLSFVRMLLMLVPYAAVSESVGIVEAIGRAADAWRSRTGLLVSFLAVGIAIIVPVWVLRTAVAGMTREYSPGALVAQVIYVSVSAIVSAWFAVAVWELYRRVGKPAIQEVVASSGCEQA